MSAHGQIDVVLFDAFGTLIDLDDPVGRLRDGLAVRGEDLPRTWVAQAFGVEVDFYRTHQQEGSDPPTLARLRHRCAAVLHAGLGTSLSIDVVESALNEAIRYVVFPDVSATLDALHASGRRLGVVSNWDVGLVDVLAGVGLAGRFDVIVASAVAGMRKPDPRIFQIACEHLDVLPRNAIHVGDRLVEDVAGATGAGLRAVHLDRDALCRGPDRIGSLHELIAVIGTPGGPDR